MAEDIIDEFEKEFSERELACMMVLQTARIATMKLDSANDMQEIYDSVHVSLHTLGMTDDECKHVVSGITRLIAEEAAQAIYNSPRSN